ncbi:MAG: GTP cyclohydrolase I FolE [Gemmatimonadaceae bacterium]|nr:GTP cyclohydrolase I FolE [Gemmatimonadaceae bacterium]NUQ94598.1 GTP cyclohydrolase I FolE [Gemmatimonadaceae bacterium]NUR20510.1 GTP cyclohydrolase I FolE [Gemmatimonadaceae bacterium]
MSNTKGSKPPRRAADPGARRPDQPDVDGRVLVTEADRTGSADALYDPEYARMVARQLELLGEDPSREGLVRTPVRVARAMRWLTRGYTLDVQRVVGNAVFESESENMIMVRDIEFYSLCEHHMIPFFGRVHVAYIPDRKIVGLSKLPRLVEVFARRLQVQERLTEEIACAVDDVLKPKGVGVVVEAAHLCMMMRGVEKQASKTITSALRGVFRSDARTRDEFLRLAHNGSVSAL